MASVSVSIFLVFLLVIICDAGKKEHVEKIVIHVPYKIHKHHHTHTKYKVIHLPELKKENTFIYYKHPQIPMGHKDTQVKILIPPHQTSSIPWHHHPVPQGHVELQSHPHPPVESVSFKPSIHVSEEKPIIETHEVIPKFEFKPSVSIQEKPILHEVPKLEFKPSIAIHEKPILQTHEVIPKFQFKPLVSIQEKPIVHEVPKLEFKPSITIHEKPILQTHEVIPKFQFKPLASIQEKPIVHKVPKLEFKPSISIHEKPNLQTQVIPKFEFKPSIQIQEKPILQTVPKFEFKPSIAIHEEKPLLQVHDLNSKLPFKPSLAIHEKPILHEDLIPKFSYKLPEAKPIISTHIPKFSFKPDFKPIIHSHDLIHKFPIKPVISFPTKFNFKPIHETFVYKPLIHFPPKIHFLEDNFAHKSSHIYQVVTPKPTKGNTYAVKESIPGDLPPPTMRPMFKMAKNIKMSQNPKIQYTINSIPPAQGLKGSLIKPYDPDYEHVGYLIIDGNSQKIVGKDFKDNIHWS